MAHSRVFDVQCEATYEKLPLFGLEEFRCLWPIRQDPEREDCNDDGKYAFEDENPSPAGVATNAFHMSDSVSKKAAECPGNDRRGEEEVEPPLEFVAFIEPEPGQRKVWYASRTFTYIEIR